MPLGIASPSVGLYASRATNSVSSVRRARTGAAWPSLRNARRISCQASLEGNFSMLVGATLPTSTIMQQQHVAPEAKISYVAHPNNLLAILINRCYNRLSQSPEKRHRATSPSV